MKRLGSAAAHRSQWLRWSGRWPVGDRRGRLSMAWVYLVLAGIMEWGWPLGIVGLKMVSS
jgi:hypothetical protein